MTSQYIQDLIGSIFTIWKKVFIKCRKFGISLNPKKSNFALEERKLLGHIISKDGTKIDPDRVSAILKVGEPRSTKEISMAR